MYTAGYRQKVSEMWTGLLHAAIGMTYIVAADINEAIYYCHKQGMKCIRNSSLKSDLKFWKFKGDPEEYRPLNIDTRLCGFGGGKAIILPSSKQHPEYEDRINNLRCRDIEIIEL